MIITISQRDLLKYLTVYLHYFLDLNNQPYLDLDYPTNRTALNHHRGGIIRITPRTSFSITIKAEGESS